MARIINLGGGSYHKNIDGDYIENKQSKSESKSSSKSDPVVEDKSNKSQNVNTNGANYIENIKGKIIK